LLRCEEILSPDSSLEDASGNFYTSMLALQVCECPVNAFQGSEVLYDVEYAAFIEKVSTMQMCLPVDGEPEEWF
jgi:hypothetical protein